MPVSKELLTSSSVQGDSKSRDPNFCVLSSEEWFEVPSEGIGSFWKQYGQALQDKEEIDIGQKIEREVPVILEAKFKYDASVSDPFEDDFLKLMVKSIQKVLNQSLKIEDDPAALIACVLEVVNDEGEYLTIQVRFQFPYCRVRTSLLKELKIRLVELLLKDDVAAQILTQPLNDWDSILSYPTEQLSLYGSKLPGISKPLTLKFFLDEEQQELELEYIFSPNSHSQVMSCQIDADMLAAQERHFWLPLFLSTNFWPEVKNPSTSRGAGSPGPIRKTETPLEICRALMPCLKPGRFQSERMWFTVAKAIHCSDNQGGEDGLILLMEYTRKYKPSWLYDGEDEEEAEQWVLDQYLDFLNDKLTHRSIAWYARKDNPAQYTKWHKSWYLLALEKSLSGQDTDIAEAFQKIYWLDFICSSIGKKLWWRYEAGRGRWKRMDGGAQVWLALIGPFRQVYKDMREEYAKQLQSHLDTKSRDMIETKCTKLDKVEFSIGQTGRKARLLRELLYLMYEEDFDSKLDTDINMIGTPGGILEVHKDKCKFRPGKPEDYVSKCTTAIYRKLSWEHPRVKILMKWFGQVFTIEALMWYFLKFSGSIMKGRNMDKLFSIWWGPLGDNCKSTIEKLFEAVLGPYCAKMPLTVITTRKRDSSSPSPELARAAGTRIIFLQEGDEEDRIKSGIFKELSGGDTFFARMLHDNGGDVQAMFKIVIVLNVMFRVSNPDRAVKNRGQMLPFLSTWVAEGYPESEEEQLEQKIFPVDPDFEDQIPSLASAFLWIMTQMWTKYCHEGIKVPPAIIRETTKRHWDSTNIYLQYFDECVTEARKDNGDVDTRVHMTIKNAYANFAKWYQETYPSDRIPNKPKFTKGLEEVMNTKAVGGKWAGYQLIEDDF